MVCYGISGVVNFRLSFSHFTLHAFPQKVDSSNLQVAGFFSQLPALDKKPGFDMFTVYSLAMSTVNAN